MEIFKGLADAGKCVILVSHSPEVASICGTLQTKEKEPLRLFLL